MLGYLAKTYEAYTWGGLDRWIGRFNVRHEGRGALEDDALYQLMIGVYDDWRDRAPGQTWGDSTIGDGFEATPLDTGESDERREPFDVLEGGKSGDGPDNDDGRKEPFA